MAEVWSLMSSTHMSVLAGIMILVLACWYWRAPWVRPAMRRVLLGVILALVVAGAIFRKPIARWLAEDRCLDRGGRWDEAADRCESAR